MQKWEYLTIKDEVVESEIDPVLSPRVITADLYAFGFDGWELVTVVGNPVFGLTYFFKRPSA